MLCWLEKWWWARFSVVTAVCLQIASPALAEERRLLSLLPGNVYSAPREFPSPLKRPDHYRDGDFVYTEFFSSADDTIKREYMDRWSYHEQRIPYSLTSWKHEHLSIGSLDYFDRAPYEGTVRNDFAARVLRLRLHTALTQYLARPEHAVLRHAERAMREMQSVSLGDRNPHDDDPPTELRYGYNLWEDCSRLEVATKATSFGISHPELLTQLTDGRIGRNLQLWVRTETGLGVSTALVYHLTKNLFEAGLSRILAPGVVGDVSTSQLLYGPPARSVRMQVGFQF